MVVRQGAVPGRHNVISGGRHKAAITLFPRTMTTAAVIMTLISDCYTHAKNCGCVKGDCVHENSTDSGPITVRVDLTSQDLRTGSIRLPRQLHDHFQAGELLAHEHADGEAHKLDVLPPRELQGLDSFLQKHQLKTNDAIVMHVDGQQLSLEPFYRRPRQEPATESEPTEAGADQAEPDSGDTDVEHMAHASAAPTNGPDAISLHETEPTAGHDADPEAAGTDLSSSEPPEPLQQEPAAAPIPEHAASQPDPFDGFDSFDGFEDYAENDSFGQSDSFAGESFRDLAATDGEPGPLAPDANPNATTQAATPPEPPAESTAPAAPFHVVRRRAFTLNRGPVATKRPKPIGEVIAARKATATVAAAVPAPQQPGAQVEPQVLTGEQQQFTEAPRPNEAVSLVREFLASPGLPSILNAKELSGRLGIAAEELTEILSAMAAQPDSRLSVVRPGFYLLKRVEQS